jgi:hypothetical protein
MSLRAVPTPALAGAAAYLRINRTTRCADIVNGAQANYVLTEVYTDDQVNQEKGGGFVVTDSDWTVISYTPLHADQDLLRGLSDAYRHWGAPGGGTQLHVQANMPGKTLGVLLTRAPGRFYRTRVGEIAHLHGGRLRNIFKPAEDLAQAA